jgi:hypothetical protein
MSRSGAIMRLPFVILGGAQRSLRIRLVITSLVRFFLDFFAAARASIQFN